jgi:hypothetical protein
MLGGEGNLDTVFAHAEACTFGMAPPAHH